MAGRKTNIPANILSRITKVFVTNLPEKCSGNDLSASIRSYGDIYDLYIARKRDKVGNRFGFVSFLDVKDSKDLIRSICNTRIGDCRLKANIARFTLEEGEIRQERVNGNKHSNSNQEIPKVFSKGPSFDTFVNGSRSFSDMLTGIERIRTVTVGDHVRAFSGLHGKAVVARLIDLEALKSIYLILNDICPGKGKVQYLGGLSVLISFEDEKLVTSFMNDAREMLGRFSSLELWEGQTFGFERLAWIKMVGIPLHLIHSDVIDSIGNAYGKIVHKAVRLDVADDLSYVYAGLLVGEGKRTCEEVKISWRDRKFSIWVSEESGMWVQEFYKVPMQEDESEDDSASSESDDQSSDDAVPVEEECPEVPIPANDVDPLYLERINGIDGALKSPIIMENFMEGDIQSEDFVPGILFNFEKGSDVDFSDSLTHTNIVNKRKKKSFLGSENRPNPAYSSSLEKKQSGQKAQMQR
ncbi:putative RNA recognition motif domain, nucleotide-binding alpha-beta plait domain superfamily [Helianthus annuus]|nr:putative RNA recognition motif domain, nucleotide-binding alpha-beta plait domain superfamily [Helianthus annuus]